MPCRVLFISLGLLLAAPAAAAPPPQRARLFALVIGTNVSQDPEVKALRYADDDAIQNASLLNELGADVVLLVQPDAESRQLFPEIRGGPPTVRAVNAALDELNKLMDLARAAGASPILYLFYSGHGEVENNEGYVNLQDGKLWRRDLISLLRRSRADQNHLVVDACKSYFLAYGRGAGGERSPLRGALIDGGEGVPTNTGVFLSTSSAKDSHEWEAFRGGIFSHEVRSGLRGAADIDADGWLTYEEISAFLWTANTKIPNPRLRPQFFSRPPWSQSPSKARFLGLAAVSSDRLVVGPGVTEHLFVEDTGGLRLADFRLGNKQRVEVLLPRRRPLFVRNSDGTREVTLPKGSRLLLSMLPLAPSSSSRRGAEHVAFQHLFGQPFDADALAAYRHRPAEIEERQRPATDWKWFRRGLGLGGLGVGLAGVTVTAIAAKERGDVNDGTSALERQARNRRIDALNTTAVVCYAVAGASIVAYALWTLWPKSEAKIEIIPAPNGLSVRF